MAPKPKTTAHDASDSPSYPMGPFSTGGSSYTNTVPPEEDTNNVDTERDAPLNDRHTYSAPLPQEAPPVYAPPNRHPPGHAPPVGGYGSQQHLVNDHPAAPPPAYTKYTTAAQARWARSSRIGKGICIGLVVIIVILIIAVSAGVTLSQDNNNNNNSPDNNNAGPGFGNGNGPVGADCGSSSDSGSSCTTGSDCSSNICRPIGQCC